MNLCFCNGDPAGHTSSYPVGHVRHKLSSAPGNNDLINHPAHYTSSPAKCRGCGKPIECIDVVQHMPFPVGAAVKYLWRLGLKGDAVEDLRKARKYIDFELARREASS